MKRIKLFLTCILLAATATAFAQNVQVKGVVTDSASGDPVSFASVQVKGTMTGTTTDADGKYTISVPANGILVFSFVGYKTQAVAVDGKVSVDCALVIDAEYLDDVMVVAYGTAKKESFTGSAATIKSDKIEKRTVSNVTKALDGLAAGVQTTSGSGQPGAGASVVIRGRGSINASSTPLYVVDGIPYDGEINALNPNDIESMTVIKDASAGALYGSRGANGVIIITTKKGAENSLSVDFKAQVGVSSRAIPRYETMDSYQWTEHMFGMFRNKEMLKGYDGYTAGLNALNEMCYGSNKIFGSGCIYNPFTVAADQLIDPTTGKIVPEAQLKWTDDWLDESTAKNPIRQDYQMNISGGNSRTKYMFSIGYLREEGLVKYTNFERFSGRANVESQILSWFKSGLNVNFAHNNSNMTSSGNSSDSNTNYSNVFYTCMGMGPIYPMYLRDENNKIIYDENGMPSYDWGDSRPSGASAGWNPLANLQEDMNQMTTDNLSGRTFIDLGNLKSGPLAGLTLSANFGFDYVFEKDKTYWNPYFGDGKSSNGMIAVEDYRTFSYTFNQLLKYDRTFGKHHVDALVGHEAYAYNMQYLEADKTGFPFGNLYELAAATTLSGGTSYTDNYNVESFLTRVNYDYADKYYISGSFRRDGSSRFEKDSRWGNFWSVGASWRISQEGFMQGADWLNNLTLKASYGVQGNDDLRTYYAWQSLYDLGFANGNNPGAMVTSLESKELQWEKNANFNAGIEARFIDRISLSFEYYNRYTRDMLMEYPMATSLGFGGYNKNIGNMKNSGVEFTISGDIIKNQKVNWNMTLMGSTNHNTVLNLADKPEILTGAYIIKEGYPLYSFYLSESAGVDPATGDKLYWVWDMNEDGTQGEKYITADYSKAGQCKHICGDRSPILFGSWQNSLQIGGFDLSVMTTYSIGGLIYDNVYRGLLFNSYLGEANHVDAAKAWRQPGDITSIPRVDLNGSSKITLTEDELTDASYFAIKNITFGYNLPDKALKAMHFKGLRVFVTADNLWVFSARKGLDPQYSLTGSTGYSYTPTRTISLGLNFKF